MMATQTSTRPRSKAKKNDDSVVYKVMIALALLAFSIYMLHLVSASYSTLDGFDRMYPAMLVITLVCAAAMVACIVLAFVLRKSSARAIFPPAAVVFALFSFSTLTLRLYWIEPLNSLYILNAAVYCLYIIYMLYRMEFFLFSLVTVIAGSVFYFFSNGFGLNTRSIVLGALLVLAAAVVALLAKQAGRHNGLVALGGFRYRVFPAGFNPIMLYIACAVWLVCLVLCVLLGAAFAYYCMFAAIAFELIAAVYYTFQLK